MLWFIIFICIIIAIIAITIMVSNNSFKKHQEELRNLFVSIPNFTTTHYVADIDNRFVLLLDDNAKRLCIINEGEKTVLDYSQIISVEYIVNEKSICSKSTARTIGGAVLGGMLAGSAGAIVGGLSGKTTIDSKISSIVIKVMVRDLRNPSIEILAFDCRWTVKRKPVDPDDILCTSHSEPARQFVDTLIGVINEVDNEETTVAKAQPTTPKAEIASVADEIRKLANLRDEGILTQEEFERQKASILS